MTLADDMQALLYKKDHRAKHGMKHKYVAKTRYFPQIGSYTDNKCFNPC